MDKVVHFEVPADNLGRAKKFYQNVFGWKMMDVPGMDYVMVETTASENNRPKEPGAINGGMFARSDTAKPRSCRHRAKLKLCITPFHLGIVAGELIALQQSEGNHRAVGALVRT